MGTVVIGGVLFFMACTTVVVYCCLCVAGREDEYMEQALSEHYQNIMHKDVNSHSGQNGIHY